MSESIFHSSARNRAPLFHIRANTDERRVERLALSFGANVIILGTDSRGMLRKEATNEYPLIAGGKRYANL
jgi:hypothetical protein